MAKKIKTSKCEKRSLREKMKKAASKKQPELKGWDSCYFYRMGDDKGIKYTKKFGESETRLSIEEAQEMLKTMNSSDHRHKQLSLALKDYYAPKKGWDSCYFYRINDKVDIRYTENSGTPESILSIEKAQDMLKEISSQDPRYKQLFRALEQYYQSPRVGSLLPEKKESSVPEGIEITP